MSNKQINVGIMDFDNVAKTLYQLADTLKKSEKDFSKAVAEFGVAYLDKQYKNLYSDPNLTDIHTKISENENGYSITAYGNDVIYAEFGTGDMGEESNHENKKAEFNLNDYNSGATIRNVNSLKTTGKALQKVAEHGIVSGNYWTYKKNGNIYYTQGVPAGKQMFNTAKYLKDGAAKKIILEKLGELNDTFINSIKK